MTASSGLLVYRLRPELEVLIVHPGGPFWANKDDGAWSIPKGELEPGEDPLAAARREFGEELGMTPPASKATSLGQVKQKSGKVVHAWAVEGDVDVASVRGNTVDLEWPPRSGRVVAFPEIDRAAWVDPAVARKRLNPAQAAFVDRLLEIVAG